MILIPLTQERFALVDDADADLLAMKWYAVAHRKTFYAVRMVTRDGKRVSEFVHRVISRRMGIIEPPDHKNRCGLDNRRENLREATHSQNIANQSLRSNNTSGFKGVYWNKRVKRWVAQINVNQKPRSLGLFASAEEAARVRDAAALVRRGLLDERHAVRPMDNTQDSIDGYVMARCHEMQLGPQAVKGPCRQRELVKARSILATELRQAPWELSLPAIGKALGGRDHSTVFWLLKGGRHK